MGRTKSSLTRDSGYLQWDSTLMRYLPRVFKESQTLLLAKIESAYLRLSACSHQSFYQTLHLFITINKKWMCTLQCGVHFSSLHLLRVENFLFTSFFVESFFVESFSVASFFVASFFIAWFFAASCISFPRTEKMDGSCPLKKVEPSCDQTW